MKSYYFVLSIGTKFFADAKKEFTNVEDAAVYAMYFLERNEENFCDNVWFCELRCGEVNGHRYRIEKDGLR